MQFNLEARQDDSGEGYEIDHELKAAQRDPAETSEPTGTPAELATFDPRDLEA